jgi:hypothetical protein
VPPKWRGVCASGPGFPPNACNRKLVGARFFSVGYETTSGRMNETAEVHGPRLPGQRAPRQRPGARRRERLRRARAPARQDVRAGIRGGEQRRGLVRGGLLLGVDVPRRVAGPGGRASSSRTSACASAEAIAVAGAAEASDRTPVRTSRAQSRRLTSSLAPSASMALCI